MDLNSSRAKADLHLHTTCSDGAFDVRDVVQLAHNAGISTMSITDHDTIDAIPDAIACAAEFGMTCIPGIELTTRCGEIDMHVLGYFFDYSSQSLRDYIDRACLKRIERAERIVRKLNKLGVALTLSDVMHRANGAAVGRPHIAGALIDRGFVSTYQKAFHQYLADNGPAFEQIDVISVQDGIALLHSIGGLAVIAHPAILNDEAVKTAIDAGIDGIEVIHPSSNGGKAELYRSIATEYFLVQTGGSDFHGGVRNDNHNLGKFFVHEDDVDKMKIALKY